MFNSFHLSLFFLRCLLPTSKGSSSLSTLLSSLSIQYIFLSIILCFYPVCHRFYPVYLCFYLVCHRLYPVYLCFKPVYLSFYPVYLCFSYRLSMLLSSLSMFFLSCLSMFFISCLSMFFISCLSMLYSVYLCFYPAYLCFYPPIFPSILLLFLPHLSLLYWLPPPLHFAPAAKTHPTGLHIHKVRSSWRHLFYFLASTILLLKTVRLRFGHQWSMLQKRLCNNELIRELWKNFT